MTRQFISSTVAHRMDRLTRTVGRRIKLGAKERKKKCFSGGQAETVRGEKGRKR